MVDTCFLINWTYFRQREDLFKLFSRLVIPSIIYSEVKDKEVKDYIVQLLLKKRLLLVPRTEKVDRLALKLFNVINSIEELPTIDPPEAYALALAKYLKIPLLTDNASPRLATIFVKELKGLQVYDSLIILTRIYYGKRLQEKVKEFSSDTHILFSEKRLKKYGIK